MDGSLESWVIRAQAGEVDAYEQIVRRFQDMAYRYAYTVLGDFDLAQDAAQEAFIETYRCLPNLREPLAFPGWFKRIVFKHCDRLTRGKRVALASLDAVGELVADVPGPVEMVERGETTASVLQAVHSLPENERQAIALYYGGGYAQNEIAAFLEVPASTIKSRLYAARKRLKERMLEMVQEALESNALPENFTQETIELAVNKAKELNKEREFDQAENLLRDVLGKSPDHPGALKELNRTLMWGRVYGQARWDKLPELVEHGKKILSAGGADDSIYHEVACTLLAIPAMPEAIVFIQDWIEQQGANLIRLGMLAWAKGCVAEYDQAEVLWNELLPLAADLAPQEAATHVQHVCMTLVDCFSAAGELARAARVAQAGWEACLNIDAFPHRYGDPPERRTDGEWLNILYMAGLPLEEAAQQWLDKLGPEAERDLAAQGVALSIRAWVDDMDVVTADWLAWGKKCAQADAWPILNHISSSQTGLVLRFTRRPEALTAWARAIRQWLKTVPGEQAQAAYERMKWNEFNGWAYLDAGDLDGAERIARQAIAQEGDPLFYVFLSDVAIRRGEPTPPEVLQLIAEHSMTYLDDYGMESWYLIAREAAAAGDTEKAFEALERAVGYWSNGPLYFVRVWEQDAYWGELREHPEYKRIYAEKRQRIGPIHRLLHYFPGW
ncbi:MAG: sigma-70 family RNA polymerase sigma factor [Anaerolineae bacterium]|nr:sigma-70 family RNA polymerase sigma factor [Anaerolineae bacterium]